MNVLWAPWRLEYIKSDKKKNGCILCNVQESNENIIELGEMAFVILNKYPYNSGHLMICPKRHVSSLEELQEKEMLEIFKYMKKSMKVLKNSIKPMGFNVGLNQGRAAGAGIEEHLHFHIVPRWTGDTNFMPIIGETKVLSQYLEKAQYELQTAFHKETHRKI
ncbi:MAG: HIT domain-containing protein [Deltaproteobacteria bacterium]|nr:HIT domain-containing protein [Deltaproteobacteria bacterium]